MTNKSGYVYESATKAWLNGMGYSEEEEQRIIRLALEIESDKSLNAGTAEIAAKYSGANLNPKNTTD